MRFSVVDGFLKPVKNCCGNLFATDRPRDSEFVVTRPHLNLTRMLPSFSPKHQVIPALTHRHS
jgi:hypothetical protein